MNGSPRLAEVRPDLEVMINQGTPPPPVHHASEVTCQTVQVAMRDGTRLATDVWLPPVLPAPVVVVRTPVARDMEAWGYAASLMAMARRGYVAISQDVRGTGDSEPDSWDYFVYEPEDGFDTVEWIRSQVWCDGSIFATGGSYLGITAWQAAAHPATTAIAPSVSALGVARNTAHLHMFVDSYAQTVGKGEDKADVAITEMEKAFEEDTRLSGLFNDPLHPPWSAALVAQFPELHDMAPGKAGRWLFEQYCAMTCAERLAFAKAALGVEHVAMNDMERLPDLFGRQATHARLVALPQPDPADTCRLLHAPPLLRTGWYDWSVYDALATFQELRRSARPEVALRAKLVITPWAHNMPGYREGADEHPELLRINSDLATQSAALLHWFESVREGTTDDWPTVIFYLMGANEWRAASDWPVPGAEQRALYLGEGGTLNAAPPETAVEPDRYTYDPLDPTPTVGGSIVSFLLTPGAVDVAEVQQRPDVLVYTSAPLEEDLDVVGPLTMVLHASSSARDTDWVARLSDVFPDGRALQLQSGILRARYRYPDGEPELLEPGRVYRFEIDLWATANRFKAGHRLRVDIASADFPHYDRNSNRGGEPGQPITAEQAVFHDAQHPSHLVFSVLPKGDGDRGRA